MLLALLIKLIIKQNHEVSEITVSYLQFATATYRKFLNYFNNFWGRILLYMLSHIVGYQTRSKQSLKELARSSLKFKSKNCLWTPRLKFNPEGKHSPSNA